MKYKIEQDKKIEIKVILYIMVFILLTVSIKWIVPTKIVMTMLVLSLFVKIFKKIKSIHFTTIDVMYIIFLIQPIFLALGGAEQEGAEVTTNTSFISRNMELGIVIIIFLILFWWVILKKVSFSKVFKGNSKYFLIYILYVIVSIVSNKLLNLYTIFWFLKLLVTFLLVHSIIFQSLNLNRDKGYILNLMYYSLTFLQGYIWLLSWIDPEKAISEVQTGYIRFGGTVVHPTTMSLVSAILMCYALKNLIYNKEDTEFNIQNFIVSTISLILTFGRIGLIAGIVGGMIIILSKKSGYINILIINFMVVVLIAFVVLIFSNNTFGNKVFDLISRGQGIENISGLSGRKDVWVYSYELIKNNPILGYGFLKSKDLIQSSNMYFVYYSFGVDNAFITIMLELGLIGLLIFIMGLLSYFYELKVINKKFMDVVKKEEVLISRIITFLILFTGIFSPSFGSKARIHLLILYTVLFNNIYWLTLCKKNSIEG